MKLSRIAAVAVCVLGLTAAQAFAQAPVAGAEIGFSMSRVSPDPAGQTIERGPGVLVGGWFGFQPWTPVGIQIEAIYAQKHSHLTSTQDLNLDYFEIPVLAKLKLFKGIYMLEGIAFDFPVSAKVVNGSSENDIKSTITNPDIGMVIAGAYPVSKMVDIEFRYEGGFKKVSNVDNAAVEHNRSLSGILRIKLSK